ncbi:MAG TPA: hypothetical protein VF150_05500 [Thermoanaerobaculia bacterium]
MIVKRIGVLSLGKVMGTIYGGMGLLFGLIFSFVSLLGAAFGAAFQDGSGLESMFGLVFGVGAVVFLPVFYGLMGFLAGLLTAALYNLAARFVGGLVLELE